MHTLKLCLGSLALFVLHAVILATPALAQTPRVITMPVVRIVAKARPVQAPSRCYVRPLEQGSGRVRVCPPAGQVR